MKLNVNSRVDASSSVQNKFDFIMT